MIKRVGIYIRVSTEEQAKHGYSIDSQKTRLLDWSKEHNYQVVDIYADEGKSARTKLSNRKELNRLLDDCKNDKIDRIIIWRLDRWFRNVADFYRIQDILDKHNVDWECSDEEFNTSTSNGRLYLNIKLSIAQNESDQTSDRIKFNFENMVRNKRPISGALPVGYKIAGEKQNKRVVFDDDLKQMATDMFDMYENTGSLSYTTKYLYENYPQRPIRYERVKKMLQNTMYYGMYRGVIDYCPALVTKERFDKIQTMIKKNYRFNQPSGHTFIFSGLIECYDCHLHMHGNNGIGHNNTRIPTYKCTNHFLDHRCSNNHTPREKSIEDYLINNFLSQLNKYVVSIDEIEDKKKSVSNSRKIVSLTDKLERLNSVYIDGRMDKEKYEENYKAISDEIAELKKEPTTNIRNLDKYKDILNDSSIIDLYQKLDNSNKRLFWSEYIDHIEPNPNNPTKEFVIFFK